MRRLYLVLVVLMTCGAAFGAPITDAERGFTFAAADATWNVSQTSPGQVTIRPPQGFTATLGFQPNVLGQQLPDYAAATINAWRQRMGASFRLIQSQATKELGRDAYRVELEGTAEGTPARFRILLIDHPPMLARLGIRTAPPAADLSGFEKQVLSGLTLTEPTAVVPQWGADAAVEAQPVSTPRARARLRLDPARRAIAVTVDLDVVREKGGKLDETTFALNGPAHFTHVRLDEREPLRLEPRRAVFATRDFAPGSKRVLHAEYEIRAGTPLVESMSMFFLGFTDADAFVQYEWLPVAGKVRPWRPSKHRHGLRVELEAPGGWEGLAPGVQEAGRGRAFVLGDPVPIVPLVVFGRWKHRTLQTRAGPITVSTLPGDAEQHVEALGGVAAEAWAFYDRLLGPAGAPLARRIVSSSFFAIRGLPYFVLAGKGADLWNHPPDAIRVIDASTNFSAALLMHECAHSWWGNRVLVEPEAAVFLLEGLANASALHATRELKGAEWYATLRKHVTEGYRARIAAGADAPLVPGGGYQTELAYTKGALVLEAMAREVGVEHFWRSLRRFAEASGGREVKLGELLEELFRGTSITPTQARKRWLEAPTLPELLK